jgi:XTP/dITP diphosphohydrolase
MTKQKLLIASNNKHKVDEIAQLLGQQYQLLTLADVDFEGDIEETGLTLEQNSALKARVIYEKYGIDTLADDSGLEVDALDGKPGVYSARYAGTHGNHEANMDLLLQNMEGNSNRRARFRTVLTLLTNSGAWQFEGQVYGHILQQKHGSQGFGYDPVFQPDGHSCSFAQMTLEQKNLLSHRSIAIEKLIDFLQKK